MSAEPLDFNKICRACLGKKGEMRPLYGSCLDSMLIAVAKVQVEPNDGLPETMCVQCVLQVSRAFNFKQVCERSDVTLRKVFLDNLAESCITTVSSNEADDINEGEGIETTTSTNTLVDHQPQQSHLSIDHYQQQQQQTINHHQDDEQQEKCLLIVQNLPLLNESDTHILEMTENESDVVDGDDNSQVNEEDLASIEHHMEMDLDRKDIIDMVSSLPMGENDIINEAFESYSTEACGAAGDSTDAETLLVTVDSSLFDLQAPNDGSSIELKYCCVECGLNFSQVDELNKHQMEEHPDDLDDGSTDEPIVAPAAENKFKCDVCQKVFGEAKVLRRHLKIHSPHKPHVCSICDMSFAESSNLTKHKKKHTGELRNIAGKPNLCSVCGKRFKWASSLSKHMKHHTKHKILNCPYCPKYYVEARSLSIHIRSHTGEKPFVCQICQKGFTQMGNLDKHMRVHTGEKPFLCPLCGKGFSQSGYVAIHVRTHTGEKPYQCQECGKGFAGSNTLAIHKRTHTGERPYPCNVCDKMFARQETAIIHQRTHTGEKPHVCSICNRGFASSGHLTGHMRSHLGTKPHECAVCQKRFAGTGSLKIHLKSHALSSDQVYSCAFCDEKYSDLSLLEEHELEHDLVDDTALLQSNINVIEIMDSTGIMSNEVLVTDESMC